MFAILHINQSKSPRNVSITKFNSIFEFNFIGETANCILYNVLHRSNVQLSSITCLLFTDLNPTKHGLTIQINNQSLLCTFFHFFYFRDISNLAHECVIVIEKFVMFNSIILQVNFIRA